jgi:hypothetical protein
MIYNLVCNSANAIGATANKSTCQYAVDWSFLPEGKYRLTFKLTSLKTGNGAVLNVVIPDLGADLKSYTAGTVSGAFANRILGQVSNITRVAGDLGSFQCNYQDNHALHLSSKPCNNTFTVELRDISTNALFDPTVDYTLVLSFTHITEE